MKNETSNWIFVIDTDSYAENFEREMCAYITGVTGDCEVGEDFAALYVRETGKPTEDGIEFLELLEQRPDEHGCFRPCSIWPTRGWLNDGDFGAIPDDEFDQDRANENYRKSQKKYYRDCYNGISNLDLNDERVKLAKWNKETVKCELNRLQGEIDRCKTLVFPKTQAYNSVAIFFYDKPSEENIAFMKKRAYKFAEAKRKYGREWNKNFKLKILGFRLIEEMKKEKEKEYVI
jgi:hypothetical protein